MKNLQGARCLFVAPDVAEIRLAEVSLQAEGMETVRHAPFELPADISELPDADVVIADGDALPGREPQDFAAQIGTRVLWLSTRRLELDSRTVTTLRKPFSPPELVMIVREMVPEATISEPESTPQPETFVPQRVVLDLCPGGGHSMVHVAAEAPEALVVGIDCSEDAIMRAHRRLRQIGVENAGFAIADVTALPFMDASIDDVYGLESLPGWIDIQELNRAGAEINRVSGKQLWEDIQMATQEQGLSLSDLRANNPDIRAAALVTSDGFAVEADCGPDVDEESLAALAADLLARASRSSKEFGNGQLDELYARGPDGYLIVERAGDDQVLACLASAEATIGLLLRDVREAACAAAE